MEAFLAAWFKKNPDGTPDRAHAERLYNLARRYAWVFREDPEDMLQRVLLHLTKSDLVFGEGDNVYRIAERTMRNMKSNQKRSFEGKKMELHEPTAGEDDAPTSKPDPEKRLAGEEREALKASIFDEAEATLPEGEVGQRARKLLGCVRRGMDDPQAIADEIGITVKQVHKARELLADRLREIVKRRGLTADALRGEP